MDSPYSHHRHNHRHNHHHNHHHSQPPPQPPSSGELQFRLLCPSSKAGGLIGKGGSVIRHLREDTGARIRVIDDSHCDERIILISAPNPNPNPKPKPNSGNSELDRELKVAQGALVKVFERIVKVDEERSSNNNNNDHNVSDEGGTDNRNGDSSNDNVVCRMLIRSNQIGGLLGKGGKVLDKITHESCAQIRVFGRDCLPACALTGDELIQIAGNFHAVKKALLMVSSFLHEHSISETCQGANMTAQPDSFSHRGSHASDHHSRGFLTSSASENFAPNHRMVPEEDVMFKLLCPMEKTGNLIGKGGFVVRGIENETGASIKINEAITPDSDERVVIISAREACSVDVKRSPAQDAVMRVHNRIAEIGFEPGTPVVARLLVPSQQIGCLMGKGGFIINEMRRFTGAGIKIFGRDQGPKFHNLKDELVQVTGNVQSVQDALFQITSRIREILFPPRQQLFQELPSPSVHPRHDQFSPGHYHSPVGLNQGYESFRQGPTHPSPLSQSIERIGGANSEQDRYHYSGDRAPLPPYVPERPPSPNSWYPQASNNGHSGRFSDAETGISGVISSNSQSAQMQTTTVEIVVPNILLPHVYGENRINLSHLTHLSGANVVVHDPKPGESEGRVILSGTPAQLHTGQCLVQAFIFCGQPF
ncbi:hypothetical protein KSS87_017748 [Heliosperma pusillum]|nr:hypothetical protein KSS87_017748 [Heliosperma pusillum]